MAANGVAPQLYASETVVNGHGRRWKALVMEDLFVRGFLDAATLLSKLEEGDKAAIKRYARH